MTPEDQADASLKHGWWRRCNRHRLQATAFRPPCLGQTMIVSAVLLLNSVLSVFVGHDWSLLSSWGAPGDVGRV